MEGDEWLVNDGDWGREMMGGRVCVLGKIKVEGEVASGVLMGLMTSIGDDVVGGPVEEEVKSVGWCGEKGKKLGFDCEGLGVMVHVGLSMVLEKGCGGDELVWA